MYYNKMYQYVLFLGKELFDLERFFSKSKIEKNEIFNDLRESYTHWKKDLQRLNKPFFMIPNDFKSLFLKDISGGALKLYIYLGFNSRFYTGESWHTIEEISQFFEKDQRTVSKWFNELEALDLVFRGQDGYKRKANTFLKPFGFYIELIKTDGMADTKNVIDDIKINEDLNRKIKFCVILNYSFQEYTVLLISQEKKTYFCSCFLNFNEDEIKILKLQLKQNNIFVDYYDIETPIQKSSNKELTIYNYLLKYLEEEYK